MDNDEARLFSLSICRRLIEGGYELPITINWEEFFTEKDYYKNSSFSEYYRILCSYGKGYYNNDLPYECKKIIKRLEDEEEIIKRIMLMF